MSAPECTPLLSDPFQDLAAATGTAAADSALEHSPALDREDAAPISKMRRRWQLSSRQASPAALLPMENSPGSSGATSSWQVVAPPPVPPFDVESISDGDELCPLSLCFANATDRPTSPSRRLLQPTPKPRAWQRRPVCLRFNSPFQVDQPGPKPIARPTGSSPTFQPQARWTQQSPQQLLGGLTPCRCLALARPTNMPSTLVRLPPVPSTPLCSAQPLLPSRLVWNLQAHSQPRLLLLEPHAQLPRRPALCVLWIRMMI